jgi:hypothetical protein
MKKTLFVSLCFIPLYSFANVLSCQQDGNKGAANFAPNAKVVYVDCSDPSKIIGALKKASDRISGNIGRRKEGYLVEISTQDWMECYKAYQDAVELAKFYSGAPPNASRAHFRNASFPWFTSCNQTLRYIK